MNRFVVYGLWAGGAFALLTVTIKTVLLYIH